MNTDLLGIGDVVIVSKIPYGPSTPHKVLVTALEELGDDTRFRGHVLEGEETAGSSLYYKKADITEIHHKPPEPETAKNVEVGDVVWVSKIHGISNSPHKMLVIKENADSDEFRGKVLEGCTGVGAKWYCDTALIIPEPATVEPDPKNLKVGDIVWVKQIYGVAGAGHDQPPHKVQITKIITKINGTNLGSGAIGFKGKILEGPTKHKDKPEGWNYTTKMIIPAPSPPKPLAVGDVVWVSEIMGVGDKGKVPHKVKVVKIENNGFYGHILEGLLKDPEWGHYHYLTQYIMPEPPGSKELTVGDEVWVSMIPHISSQPAKVKVTKLFTGEGKSKFFGTVLEGQGQGIGYYCNKHDIIPAPGTSGPSPTTPPSYVPPVAKPIRVRIEG